MTMDATNGTKPAGAFTAPRPFVLYTAVLSAIAAVFLVLALVEGNWDAVTSDERFWAMALFVVIGELMPIEVPRRGSSDEVTISAAFAFALLIAFGVEAAIVVYVIASLISDLVLRIAPIKILFNVAQYVLSLAAAGA